jgi:hypothetical protein
MSAISTDLSPATTMQRDYLSSFLGAISQQIQRQGAERTLNKLRLLFPTDARPSDNFVPAIRSFALMALDQIAVNYASSHGKQKPVGDHKTTVAWLSRELNAVTSKELSRLFYLERTVILAGDLLQYQSKGVGEPSGNNNHDICEMSVFYSALLVVQLAESVQLEYVAAEPSRSFISRKISEWRRDKVNYGWEKDVLGRLSAILPSLISNGN